MLDNQNFSIPSPGVGDRVVKFRNNASIPPYVVVENKDLLLGVAIEFQESDDGTTWNTIVGTSQSIDPGQSNGQIIDSSRSRLALFSTGAVNLEIHVIRNRNFNGTVKELD